VIFEVGKLEAVTRGIVAPVRWFRPPDGFYKVNFDAALFENLGCAGIGMAVWDSDGAIIAALSQRIPLPLSVEMAEAMAVRRAVLFVQEMCLSKVLVEGDCLRVVSAMNSLVCCNTLYGNVIEESCRQANQFQACKFIHVRRGGNKLAHALARRAVSFADFNVWVEELPFDLECVLQNDIS